MTVKAEPLVSNNNKLLASEDTSNSQASFYMPASLAASESSFLVNSLGNGVATASASAGGGGNANQLLLRQELLKQQWLNQQLLKQQNAQFSQPSRINRFDTGAYHVIMWSG